MARYTGPKSRIARKFGEGIFGADKVLSKKNYPPGQHGNSRKRKTSEYGVQLREKQKAKYTYGVLEKQFRNLFEKAETAKGITGEVLLQLLEGRLDNVVFRLGIAPTRAAARQLVGHKHITVDGEVVNIPSYAVKPGQLIGVRERSKSLEVIANSLAGFNHSKYAWLEWDEASKVGKMLHIPERADIPENIKEHLIVELEIKVFDKPDKAYPFRLNVEMVGFFECENCEENDIEEFKPNAVAILYPYARALVTSITANANTNPMILPTINTNKLLNKENDKK